MRSTITGQAAALPTGLAERLLPGAASSSPLTLLANVYLGRSTVLYEGLPVRVERRQLQEPPGPAPADCGYWVAGLRCLPAAQDGLLHVEQYSVTSQGLLKVLVRAGDEEVARRVWQYAGVEG